MRESIAILPVGLSSTIQCVHSGFLATSSEFCVFEMIWSEFLVSTYVNGSWHVIITTYLNSRINWVERMFTTTISSEAMANSKICFAGSLPFHTTVARTLSIMLVTPYSKTQIRC